MILGYRVDVFNIDVMLCQCGCLQVGCLGCGRRMMYPKIVIKGVKFFLI